MVQPSSQYGWLDEATLTAGLGLVLLGVVVMGVFETLIGSAHFSERVIGVGVIIVHTSITPHLRAYVIALGFVILLVWGFSRISRAILKSLRADS